MLRRTSPNTDLRLLFCSTLACRGDISTIVGTPALSVGKLLVPVFFFLVRFIPLVSSTAIVFILSSRFSGTKLRWMKRAILMRVRLGALSSSDFPEFDSSDDTEDSC